MQHCFSVLNRAVRASLIGLVVVAVAASVVASGMGRASDGGIRLMSFNIRMDTLADGVNAWPNRADRVVSVLVGRGGTPDDPALDIIGLQEVLDHQLEHIKAAVPGYGHVGVGRDDGRRRGEYSPILFRRDRLQVLDSGTFWLSETPEVPGSTHWGNRVTRICTWARFRERGGDRTLWVYNTHFDHASERARRCAAELVAAVMATRADAGSPAVLLGDFNAHPESRVVRYLTGGLNRARPGDDGGWAVRSRLVDAWAAAHGESDSGGTWNGWAHPVRSGARIDYIFVSADLEVLAAGVERDRGVSTDGRPPSDHYPVLAEVRW